ncbi:FIST signal transduction protein [Chitinimonas koreensis]|uniref:FIST signal transduction protein n=1 Tax=Chitinimonas koreensis TaxID=356302 RepID=UPI000406ABE9|nr:FIST N-terminal domain-containing protein [Chitinimonas koreensis]QNM97587.1 FIST C-terminal domain-containing protein [Chitinimonas koreensis]
MRARSTHTLISDPYRAGVALGEALADLEPEVVFLFSAVHYGGSAELLEGLRDVLGRDELVVIGNSGDGFYSGDRASDLGAVALGLNSEGEVAWTLAAAAGLGADPAGATREAFVRLRAAAGGEPDLVFLAADFRADASLIEAVLRDEVDCPVMGGLAADDNRMAGCYLYAGDEVLQDAVVLLGARGPIRFDIRVANDLTPVGRPGRVDEAEGTQLQRIDGIGAMAFIERETGKPVLQTDRGVVALSVIDPARPAQRSLRAIVPDFGAAEGAIGLYGGIEPGKTVQVCLTGPAELLREVKGIAEQARSLEFEPVAGLLVSCTGRKQLLGGEIAREAGLLGEAFGGGLPLAGYPSFGEIGPLRDGAGYTRNLFHNMTYIVLLIGA